ncbi:MAG: S8 family serine peptidase [Phycisphaeraceae bacterium]|nr:S8 family serine peptidase [Phycisphaeraceae bacterium]
MPVMLIPWTILAMSSSPAPEPARMWVFFRDRDISDQSSAIAAFESRADPRQIARRTLRRSAPGLFDARDLPVSAAYANSITDCGARIRVRSRWLNAVSVEASSETLAEISALPFVDRIEPVRGGRPREATPIVPSGRPIASADATLHGYAFTQLNQIGIVALHDLEAVHGEGVIIGILDTGFQLSHDVFNHPDHPIDVIASWDFINDDGNVGIEAGDPEDQHVHGTCVLSTIAGYAPGEFMGGAWGASFVLAKTEDISQEVPLEEDLYVAGLEFIEAHGADVATSSLGYIDWYTQGDLDGFTAVTTIAVNVATQNGLVCVTAAGNGGNDQDQSTLIAPSDAFDVIACGAVNEFGETEGFSSRGPTADGRAKPEILAMGRSVVCADPWAMDGYVTASGTSLSTPLIASGVALALQMYPNWTVERVRTRLFTSAGDYLATGTFDPAFIRGYGIASFWRATHPMRWTRKPSP